jgi:uncharacterized membrane protein YdjX (TVP38/TMEM64 family)
MENKSDNETVNIPQSDLESHNSSNSRSQSLRSLVMILAVAGVLIFVAYRDMKNIEVFIQKSGWVGMLVGIGIYGLMGASPIPSEPLTVFLSSVIGPFQATIITGLGNLLAATVEYMIGMHVGNAASFDQRKEKLPFGLGKMPVDSVPFLLLARMIPGYGAKFVSLICGIYRVPLLRYVWTTGITTIIGAAVFAYGGFGILQLGK